MICWGLFRVLAGLCMMAAVASPGYAAIPLEIVARTGNHGDFGRVVFDLPVGATARAVQDGARIVVHLDLSARLTFGPPPRNVQALGQAEDAVEIVVAPGAMMRLSRLGSRFIVDVMDPPAATPKTVKSRLAAPKRPQGQILHGSPPDGLDRAREASAASAVPKQEMGEGKTPPPGKSAADGSTAPAPAAHPPETAVGPDASQPGGSMPTSAPALGSLALAARPLAGDSNGSGPIPSKPAIALPFAATTGAAAFRRGDAAFVVFDERKPIDMAALTTQPDFSAAAITMLPEATLLRIPLSVQSHLVLARANAGWSVAINRDDRRDTVTKPFAITVDQGRLIVAADRPGRVISVPDPLTGGVLLVGTQLVPGQGMPVARTAPEFGFLETWQGIAIIPVADSLRLDPVQAGFVIALDPARPLAVSSATPQTASEIATQGFSRRFDFPNLPTEQLRQRLQSAIADAAASPPQSRGAKRIAVAQAMIALGLGAEAQALLSLAATDDATQADDRDRLGLAAIAALLAGRVAEADGIIDPRLDGSDDVTLWRAVRLAMRTEGAPASAASLASVSGLVLAYPPALRAKLLPLVVETMVQGGEASVANVLVKTNLNETGLEFASALLAARDPARVTIALASLDRMAAGNDRLLRARSAEKAIELRLASGVITQAQAADGFERQIYAWRGDERELAIRLRTAELRADTNAWRPALRLLRETAELWPDASAILQPRLIATFMRALATDSANPLPPLELLALAEENADLIPAGETGRAVSGRLADRLIALDLPQRAIPLLTRLLGSTQDGTTRSELGGKLAAMQLQIGKPAEALEALSDTLGVGSMPPDLLEQRTLIFARASNEIGQHDQAVAVLEALGTLPAVQLQAQLQEGAKNWPGAMQALQRLTAMAVPLAGALNENQAKVLLRLASAAAEVGAVDVLALIRNRDLPRLPAGKTADLIGLLTSGPVQQVADLPRAGIETRTIATAIKGAGL